MTEHTSILQHSEQNFIQYLTALQSLYDACQNPQKNSTNPHHKNDYADLEAVLNIIKPALSANKFVMQQVATVNVTELVAVLNLVTTLTHTPTGFVNKFCASCPIPKHHDKYTKAEGPATYTPQEYGSALSYLRRYTNIALFNMVQTDDDGNAASLPPPKAKPAQAPSGTEPVLSYAAVVEKLEAIPDPVERLRAMKAQSLQYRQWGMEKERERLITLIKAEEARAKTNAEG